MSYISSIIYNNINLRVVESHPVRREVVYEHGFAYKYTRWTIRVRAIFDPAATSYDTGSTSEIGAGGAVLQAGVGAAAAAVGGGRLQGDPVAKSRQNANLTDAAVRQQLLQPRKQLVYAVGDLTGAGVNAAGLAAAIPQLAPDRDGGLTPTDFFESPYRGIGRTLAGVQNPGPAQLIAAANKPFYIVDCNNGPIPLSCTVTKIIGTTNFHVEWECQADVNEWHNFYTKPPILLSQLWSSSIDYDQDGFATRAINGRVVFRTDVLTQQKTIPDDYRVILLHPVPRGFTRRSLKLSQLEDGNTLRYQIIDVEEHVNIAYPAVTRVDAGYRLGEDYPKGIEETGQGLFNAAMKAFSAKVDVGGLLGGVVATMYRTLPAIKLTVYCRCWGNKASSLQGLRDVAEHILALRVGNQRRPGAAGGIFARNTFNIREHGSWSKRFAEVEWDLTLSGLTGLIQLLKNIVANNPNRGVDGLFPFLRETSTFEDQGPNAGIAVLDGRPEGYKSPDHLQSKLGVFGKGFNGQDAAFATYVRSATAQALWDSSTTPPAPPTLDPVNQGKSTLNY